MELTKQIFSKQISNEYIQYLKKEEYETYYSTKNKFPYIVIERLSMNTGNPAEGYKKVKRSEVDDPFRPDPEVKERRQLWKKEFQHMDISELDISFLARQFKLSGGDIHSIALNTCFRSNNLTQLDTSVKATMEHTLQAVKQELKK